MSHNKRTAKLLDRTETFSPSPARDALRGNLDGGEESTLTLRKKKSWMATFRDAMSKGALSAKATVDSWRDGPQEPEQRIIPERDTDGPAELECRPRVSIDSKASTKAHTISSSTPMRPHNERRNTVMSKFTTTSLRQHIRNKRSSVYSVATRPSSEMVRDIAGPEHFTTPPRQPGSPSAYNRRTSVASSVVGSIKGLGRRAGVTRPPSQAKEESPKKLAETVPLPSSPIDIPAAAPALELDFGPAGLTMLPSFAGSPEQKKKRTESTLKLTDPRNITSGRPKSKIAPIAIGLPHYEPVEWNMRPITPANLLNLKSEAIRASPPTAPATPMPGTNFTLEVDGASSEKSERSQVFERSVTPPNEKERKELRAMRSLDAMAEACAIAHANDELAQSPTASDTEKEVVAPGSPELNAKPTLQVPTARRNFASADTVHTIPADMPELSRQDSPRLEVQELFQTGSRTKGQTEDDPFYDDNAVNIGPPSPERSVRLPFRLKESSDGSKEAPAELDANTHSNDQLFMVLTEPLSEVKLSTPKDPAATLQEQLQLQRSETITAPRPNAESSPARRESSDWTDVDEEDLSSDDDAPIPEVVQAEYDQHRQRPINDGTDGLSPHGGPIALHTINYFPLSQNSSPGSVRSRTTYTAGLVNTEYKFTFENWLKETTAASAPPGEQDEPVTPSRNRRHTDVSLDSVSSTEERKTPQISPATTGPDRTPSMGNRLDFDLKRSQRNMRYNALHQQDLASGKNAEQNVPSSHRQPLRFIVGGGSEETTELQLANFEAAYNSSREGSPEKDNRKKPLQERVESVADSLKDAAYDYSQLEERLGEPEDVFADPADTGNGENMSPSSETNSTERAIFEYLTGSRSPPPGVRVNGKSAQLDTRLSSSNDFSSASKQHTGSPTLPQNPTAATPDPATHSTFLLPSSTWPYAPKAASSSPSTLRASQHKDRVISTDTLDESLEMFGSPDSGYQADETSAASASKGVPLSNRSPGRKRSGGRVLSEISRNIT
ncbi:hypothetical protein LTR37_018085 [Vermiconidia calcicola]|uniref:Uncharacterized protein n=1 Tax=Vermiconidia calcicola TaxID=1690605 RepID=A0ACC3MJU1_9PEZI|nr:hypothetical protein LTR37_018085 [Vermiconidia calcicola]